MCFEVALSGDSIVSKRISECRDDELRQIIDVLRTADVAYTHLESTIDGHSDEAYPSVRTLGTWLRSPDFVTEEFEWAGIDIVSTPSNHTFDYSYGGLYDTWEALNDAGIPHAGTGRTLAEARSPVYFESDEVTVALVSMASSYYDWNAAGETGEETENRPGVNPLRYHYAVGSNVLATVKSFANSVGWFVAERNDDTWLIKPPGLHYPLVKFVAEDEFKDGRSATVVHDGDAEANLRAVQEASDNADIVLTHVHAHEWKPTADVHTPPAFLTAFAKRCIDAGADVFLSQGSHSLRGVELYDDKPIFYDLGGFMTQPDERRRPPNLCIGPDDHVEVYSPESPSSANVTPRSCIVPVCTFDDDGSVTEITIYPVVRTADAEGACDRVPRLASGSEAHRILERIAGLSAPFGTDVQTLNGTGVIEVSP